MAAELEKFREHFLESLRRQQQASQVDPTKNFNEEPDTRSEAIGSIIDATDREFTAWAEQLRQLGISSFEKTDSPDERETRDLSDPRILGIHINTKVGARLPDDVKLDSLCIGYEGLNNNGVRKKVFAQSDFHDLWYQTVALLDKPSKSLVIRSLGSICRNRVLSTVGQLRNASLDEFWGRNFGISSLLFIVEAFQKDGEHTPLTKLKNDIQICMEAADRALAEGDNRGRIDLGSGTNIDDMLYLVRRTIEYKNRQGSREK